MCLLTAVLAERGVRNIQTERGEKVLCLIMWGLERSEGCDINMKV